jgi:hypothetical protein
LKTWEAVESAILEWVSWFTHSRRLEAICYIPHAEAEANYYRQFASPAAIPARLKQTSLHEIRGDSLFDINNFGNQEA